MVSIQQVKRGIAAFIDNEIMPGIPNGAKKILIGTYISLALKNLDKGIGAPAIAFLGIAENGNVDIDTVIEQMKNNIPLEGMKVDLTVMGMNFGDIKFHKDDADRLKNYILNS